MRSRPWLEGAGLSLLYLLPPISSILSPSRRDAYHQLLPLTTLIRGITLGLAACAIAAGFYFFLSSICRDRMRDILLIPTLAMVAWIVGRDSISMIENVDVRNRLLLQVHYLPLLLLLVSFLLWLFRRKFYREMTRVLLFGLAAAGFSALVFVMPRLAYDSLSSGPQESQSWSRPAGTSRSPDSRRIVWLLFDELSYGQAFDHRAIGLELPNFDELAQHSITFSQLHPVGDRTDVVIPSLFLGERMADIRADAKGNLQWKPGRGAQWRSFRSQDSIFAKAQQLGWSTSVTGWFNPYCRILASELNHCFWQYSEPPIANELFGGLASRKTVLENALFSLPFSARSRGIENLDQQHRDDYMALMQDAASAVKDPSLRFLFIHLPIPHPPVIYKRPATGKELDGTSYLDNLALADQALGSIRDVIADTTAAQETILIVSSDHSWRVNLWRGGPAWSPKDEEVSHHGIFDDRPVLLVHYPDQSYPAVVSQPTSAMIVHTVLLLLLEGKLSSANAAMLWLRSQ